MTRRPHETASGCKGIAEILKDYGILLSILTLHLWFSSSPPVEGSPKNTGKLKYLYYDLYYNSKISYEVAKKLFGWGSGQHEELW